MVIDYKKDLVIVGVALHDEVSKELKRFGINVINFSYGKTTRTIQIDFEHKKKRTVFIEDIRVFEGMFVGWLIGKGIKKRDSTDIQYWAFVIEFIKNIVT